MRHIRQIVIGQVELPQIVEIGQSAILDPVDPVRREIQAGGARKLDELPDYISDITIRERHRDETAPRSVIGEVEGAQGGVPNVNRRDVYAVHIRAG